MKWIRRALVATVVVALLLAGFVAWVLPGIATREAAKAFEQATGRKLAIGELSIHPFTWTVKVRDLSMSEVGGRGTFASFKRAEASIGLASIWTRVPVISRVRLEGPHIDAIRTGPNTYNFSDLLKYILVPLPEIVLNDVSITDGSIDFYDRALETEEHHTLREVQIRIPFLTTIPSQADAYGNPRFSAVIDGAPLSVEAKVRGLPRAVEVSADLNLVDVSLPSYLSYFPAGIPVNVDSGKFAIKGTISYRITPEYGGEAGWDGTIAVTNAKVSEKGGPAQLTLDALTVRSRATAGQKRGLLLEDGSVEIRDVRIPFGQKDELAVGLLAIQGVQFSDRRNELGVSSVLLDGGHARFSRDRRGTFSPQAMMEGVARKIAQEAPPASSPPPTPLRYRIGKVEGKGIDVSFTDRERKEAPTFSVSGAHFLIRDVTGPAFEKIPFEFGARWGRDATIRTRGWGIPVPLRLDADVQIDNVDLSAAQPYMGEVTQVVLAGGRIDVTASAALQARNDEIGGTIRGSAAIRSLKILDRGRGKLLAWDALTITGIQGRLRPPKIHVGKIALQGLSATLVLDEDGHSNLPGGSAAATKQPKATTGAGVDDVRIGEVALTKGTIDFTDMGVPGGFHARVSDIDLRLAGVSTAPGTVADVRARLVLPKGAPLTVVGKAAPLRHPAYADLDVLLEKLDLTVANPYAAVYLGLVVDKGALTIASRAKVEDGSIAAENRIRVGQLTYGKGVHSDKATILPVRLLTDMLRNRDGDIVLNLPVSTTTDDEDPVGTLVGEAVGKAIFPPSSPLKSIPFDGCSADLTKDARHRLLKLSEALEERPAMKIVAAGYVDREMDEKACLERDAVETAALAKAAAANPPGAAAGASVPAPAPPTPLLQGDARLQQIAAARAASVRAFLVEQGKVDGKRVSTRAVDIHARPSRRGDARARVEFAEPAPARE